MFNTRIDVLCPFQHIVRLYRESNLKRNENKGW